MSLSFGGDIFLFSLEMNYSIGPSDLFLPLGIDMYGTYAFCPNRIANDFNWMNQTVDALRIFCTDASDCSIIEMKELVI